MMKKIIIPLFLLCFVHILFSQDVCGGSYSEDEFTSKSQSCLKNSNIYLNAYRYQSTYNPKGSNFIDEIVIPINIIILCDDNGDYGGYNTTTYAADTNQENWINRAYQKTSLPSDPVTSYSNSYWLTTTKIKFIINQVYFYNNTNFFNAVDPNPFIDYHFSTVPNAKNFVNCFILKNNNSNGFGYQSYHSTGAPIIVSKSRKDDNMTGNWEGAYWYWSEHLPHELGHALGLCHTYLNSFCTENNTNIDYLNDVFFSTSLYEQPCPDSTRNAWDLTNDFCTNNLMGGNPENFFASPLQAGRMHRQLRMDNIRNFAYGYSTMTHNITSNEIWDFTYKSYNDIVIKSGATLTIQCRLEMIKDSKIIIETGGKLIVDGGIITSARSAGSSNEGYWQGVEVWGTSSQNQYPDGNPTYQGILQLINGGTIENAHIAATNWKPEDFDKIGGVIISNGGIFKNNRRDLVFMSYENFQPGNPFIKKRDLSNFSNTEFIWDNNFMELGLAIQPMVTMWNVHGINYTNCHFSNNRTGSGHKAIYSIDASYTVNAGCTSSPPFGLPCPTANLLKSSFTGFTTAVEASGAGTTKVMKISQATFENNLTGVSIQEFDNVSIDRNNIKLGLAGNLYAFGGSGIVIDNSTGYIIEENSISTIPQISLSMGVSVNNSGIANNRLYKNSLNGLYVGNYPTGINRDANNALKGLQFLCNTYTSNSYAILIGSSASADGVRLYQGEYSPLKSAGNIFNSNTVSIYNGSTWPISYYHNGGSTIPTNNTANVTLYNAGTANTCKSSFGGGIIFLKQTSSNTLDSLENEVQNMQTAYDAFNYNYLSLLDGGNTQQLQSQIENNWSEDAWRLRANLLEKTPYLSQESLLEAAKQNILPNAMLLEICLANPDATKGVYFSQKLNDATDNSFPENMQEYIKGNWDSKTIRSTLEAKMASLQSELGSTRSFIKHIRASMDDYTIADRYAMVSSGKELSDKINLMDYFIENSQWLKADSVLQVVQNDKKWVDNMDLIKDFDVYISFRSSLGSRTIAQLNEAEIDYLMTLAQEKGRVAGYAQNILCFFYQICYDQQPEGGATKMILQQPQEEAQTSLPLEQILYSVTIYPNPAKEYVNLQWKILDELKNCNYKVFDLNGILVTESIISQNRGEITIDTRSFRNGMYVISVFNGNELKMTKKLVVEKVK